MNKKGAVPKTGNKGSIPVPKASTKGAIPKVSKTFPTERSKKTARTPPKEDVQNVSIYLCQMCQVEDGIEKVRCDKCMQWYHFLCANLTIDVMSQDFWICSNCEVAVSEAEARAEVRVAREPLVSVNDLIDIETPDYSKLHPQKDQVFESHQVVAGTKSNKSAKSRKSGSVTSTLSRRATLALQKLEEERRMLEQRDNEALQRKWERDKEYLNQKYSILEEDAMSNLSFDDEELALNKMELVRQWTDNLPKGNDPLSLANEEVTMSKEIHLRDPQSNSTIVDSQSNLELVTRTSNQNENVTSKQVDYGEPTSNNNQLVMPTEASTQQKTNYIEVDNVQPKPVDGVATKDKNVIFPDWSTKPFINKLPDWLTKPKSIESNNPPSSTMTQFIQNMIVQPQSVASIVTSTSTFSTTHPSSNVNTIITTAKLSTKQSTKKQNRLTSILNEMWKNQPSVQSNTHGIASNNATIGSSNPIFGMNPNPVSNYQSFGSYYNSGVQPITLSSNQTVGSNDQNIRSSSYQPVASNDKNIGTTVGVNNQTKGISLAYQPFDPNAYGSNNNTIVTTTPSISTYQEHHMQPIQSNQVISQSLGTNVTSVMSQSSMGFTSGPIFNNQPPIFNNQPPMLNTNVPNFGSQQPPIFNNQPPMLNTNVPNFGNQQPPIFNNQPPMLSTNVPIFGNQQPPILSTNVTTFGNQQSSVNASGPTYSYQSSGIPHQPSSIPYQPYSIPYQIFSNGQSSTMQTSMSYVYSQQPIVSHGTSYNQRSRLGEDDIGDIPDPNGMMTMQNIMSRQVIEKKLPIFDGNPEKWNSWYNRYVSTTDKCKLDNSENLDRLEKCLKGKAYTIVESKLSQTEAVPWIISTLKKVYGRPEVILKAVMKRIREIPPLKLDLKSLMEFAFEVQSVSTTIESSGVMDQYRNPMLLAELVDKLPDEVKLDWAKYKRGNPDVTIKTFTDWLDSMADDISSVVEPAIEKYVKKSDKKYDKEKERHRAHVNVHIDGGSSEEPSEPIKSPTCPICEKGCQKVENCSKFIEFSLDRKYKEIKEHSLCRNCLKRHKLPCKLTKVCGKDGCSIKHHHLLHNKDRHSSNDKKSPNGNSTVAGANVHYEVSQQVLLKYFPVVLHKGNKNVRTIAFLDDGSQASMLEQSLADDLAVNGTKEQLCLLWTDNIHRKENAQRVSIEISGENDLDCRYPLNGIRAVQSLHLPAQTFNKEEFMKRFPYLTNVPISDYENAIPGILIGSDFPKLGVQLKVIEGSGFKDPIAAKTRLGWIVYGPGNGTDEGDESEKIQRVVQMCPHHNEMDQHIHQQVKDYFSIENFGVRANSMSEMESKENQRALDLLKKLTKKIDGNYETGLLWKHDSASQNLPDSYPMALKRLVSLEKQGEKMVSKIGEKIEEYVAKGYARKLSETEVNGLGQNVWYLPVFGVVHPKKPEKLRMVFDGAAKVKSVSLNSMLLTGPDELASLVDILRRMREKLIGIGGDIKEMFHQVKIAKEDQKFLFRNGDTSKKPDVYVMNAMVFGLRCSPAAAQFVKNTNAKMFKKSHPRAVEAIIDNHYVDDMMDGENSIESTIQMVKDVQMIHTNGGFEIRNFISNSTEVLKAIGATDTGESKEIGFDSELKTERVLGMWWNTKLDVFTFSLKYTMIAKEVFDGTQMPTKRELLRTLMSIFDPLGLLSNFLIHLKILLQDVWRADLNWDEQIKEKNLIDNWKRWLQYLPLVETVQVPVH